MGNTSAPAYILLKTFFYPIGLNEGRTTRMRPGRFARALRGLARLTQMECILTAAIVMAQKHNFAKSGAINPHKVGFEGSQRKTFFALDFSQLSD